jgi:hypothetical protein
MQSFVAHFRLGVKTGKAQCEHMFSALPLKPDIASPSHQVRLVPQADPCTAAKVPYSITSSAWASNAGEIVRPSACAVFILIAT